MLRYVSGREPGGGKGPLQLPRVVSMVSVMVLSVVPSAVVGCSPGVSATAFEAVFVSDEFLSRRDGLVVFASPSAADTVIISTSSLAVWLFAVCGTLSNSRLDARRLSGEEARSGTSEAPPMMARWWVVLVKGEAPLGKLAKSGAGVSAPRSL